MLVLANGSWTAGHLSNLWGTLPASIRGRSRTEAPIRAFVWIRRLSTSVHDSLQNPCVLSSLDLHMHRSRRVAVVFPPCDTRALEALPLQPAGGRRPQVLSLAQFRPEKDHALQLRAFALLLQRHDALPEPRPPRPQLVVAGAVRHATDQALLDGLRELAISLNLSDADVTFEPNLPLAAGRCPLATAADTPRVPIT